MDPVWNPAYVDPALDSRAATFENPTGARGAGGAAHGGRKGAPNRLLKPGERVVLADVEGPGVIRHIWMTFPPARPERMRAVYIEVFYDDASEPSVSVPCLDFFGLPHGRPVAYASGAVKCAGRTRVQQLRADTGAWVNGASNAPVTSVSAVPSEVAGSPLAPADCQSVTVKASSGLGAAVVA